MKHCPTCRCDEPENQGSSRVNRARQRAEREDRVKCQYCNEPAAFILRGKARCYTHRFST